MKYKNKELKNVHKGVQETIQKKMNKYANKIVVGQYTGKQEPTRKEGEFWTDDENRQWTMKNGIKQRITPLQDAKTPWWCPVCGRTMKSLDIKAWRVHAKCYDCVAREESRMKMDGVWDDHKKKGILRNQIAYLTDKIIELTYYHDTLSNPEFMTFDQDTGRILMIDKYQIPLDKVKTDIMTEVVSMNKILKEKEQELEELMEKENEK
jgi:rubrerythrin